MPRSIPSLSERAAWLADDNWCVCEQARSPGRPDISWRPALLLLKPQQDFIFISLKQQSFRFKYVCVWYTACAHSVVSNSVTPWTVAHLCPWDSPGKNTGVGGHFPPPGDLPNPGVEISSPGAVLAGVFFTWEAPYTYVCVPILFQILFHYRLL